MKSRRLNNHLLAILLCLIPLLAAAAGLCAAPAESETLQREEFWKYPGLSLTVPAAGNLVNFLPLAVPESGDLIPWVIYPSQLLAHLPLYGLNVPKALWYTGMELLLPAAGIGLMAAGSNDFLQDGSALLLGAYQSVTQFSVYEVYREFRSRTPPEDAYRRDFNSRSFGEVLRGEFSVSSLRKAIVWIPTLLGPALLSGYRLLAEGDTESAVWSTGSAYIGDTEVHPAAGFAYTLGRSLAAMSLVGIGEEALYRGVIYEEIKTRTSRRTARMIDALLFPAIHLPGDIYAGFSTGTVAFQFIWRAGMTLVFDEAYDQGGVPLAAAVHMWSDVLLLLVQWLAYGGVPGGTAGSGNSLWMVPLDYAEAAPWPQQGLTLRFSIPL